MIVKIVWVCVMCSCGPPEKSKPTMVSSIESCLMVFFGRTQYPCDPFDMVVLMNKKDVLVIGWSFGRK